MAVKWTNEQRQVIETRRRNILVSAAAGSGKTAVLVERILERICDREDPVDIDELLIVTFTKAAAGEMRERITRALSDARDADPENEHLSRQIALMPGALITTIDGFCSYVVRSYGYRIGVAPGFKVADTGECELMKQDALRSVLEEAYARGDGDFQEAMEDFVEAFASGKNDRLLESAILRMASAAEGGPDPEGWLRRCREDLEKGCGDGESLLQTSWMRRLMEDAVREIRNGWMLARRNLEMTMEPEGPSAYLPTAQADFDLFDALLHCACADGEKTGSGGEKATSGEEEAASGGAVTASGGEAAPSLGAEEFDRCRALLTGFAPVRLSTKKALEGERPELREDFKNVREEIASIRKSLLEEYFCQSLEDALTFLKRSSGPMLVLIALTERFRQEYARIKEAKHVLDFSDLEHFALRILKGEAEGTQERLPEEESPKERPPEMENPKEGLPEESPQGELGQGDSRSPAARELAARFREIMIDEYQDSNYLQEEILLSVSRNADGEQNYFCVGDIKQSIYSFRQARPELFLEKGRRFAECPEEGVRIDLHRNFRSRSEVISLVNGIFRQIMHRENGGVEYDADAELAQGAEYPPCSGMTGELLTVLKEETDESGDSLMEGTGSGTARELEARAVGMRIRELMAGGEVYDRTTKAMRPVRYSDIVILLRTMEGWADVFAEVLEGMRIPAYSMAKSGYFTAMEVVEALNYLAILDNPLQDIPFASVLRSAFASLSAEELAYIRTADLASSLSGSRRREDVSLYEAARAASEAEEVDAALKGKLRDFFAFYDSIRSRMPDTPLHELISAVLTESGFMDIAAALPGGAQRTVNLRMLIDKALEFEQTSYIGLFNFMRYIESLKKYSQDFGELSALSGQEDVVRIYSIHKSKGLEFPIVFVSGMSKSFNMQDINGALLIHPSLGAAGMYVDAARRLKATTLHRQAIRRQLQKDSLGEELRVLYVALTRAEQKLIMTGTVKNEAAVESMLLLLPEEEEALPPAYIGKCTSYMKWVLPAAVRLNERAERIGLPEAVKIRFVNPSELLSEELESGIRREDVLEELESVSEVRVYDEEMRRAIRERFAFSYPHAQSADLPVEVSVSELKMEAIHGAMEALAEAGETPVASIFESKEPSGPDESAGLSGAERGTAYHRVMELLPMGELAATEEAGLEETLSARMEAMVERGLMRKEEMDCVRPSDILLFARSALGQRMLAADARGELFREQPFVLGMDAADIHAEWPEGETVFVQGIIDAFFFEGEGEERGIVLVDYKTDRVKTTEELIARYRVQLDSYAEALERITGLPVRERLIWSFRLGTEIRV